MSLKGQSNASLKQDESSVTAKIRSIIVYDLPVTTLVFAAIAYVGSGRNSDIAFILQVVLVAFAIWLFGNFRYFYRLWRIRRELAQRRAQDSSAQ